VSGEAFVRRVLQHVLPRGFQRVRHYGWLGAGGASEAGTPPRAAGLASPRAGETRAHPAAEVSGVWEGDVVARPRGAQAAVSGTSDP